MKFSEDLRNKFILVFFVMHLTPGKMDCFLLNFFSPISKDEISVLVAVSPRDISQYLPQPTTHRGQIFDFQSGVRKAKKKKKTS